MLSTRHAPRHRAIALALTLGLTLTALLGTGLVPSPPGAQAAQSFGPVQVAGPHGPACPDGAANTIQAAVDCALPGATIFVSPGTYNEAVVIATDGLTLCSHVGGPLCAVEVETGHWQKSSGATWDAAPGGAFGEAIRIEGVGSTSLFPPAGLALTDVDALSFDLFAESGDCGAGSPRVAFGIDTDGDGQRDGNVFTYGTASGSCPTGSWLHVDLDADPTAYWASGAFGGPNHGTAADAQQAIDTAAAANGASAEIVAINVQLDHSTTDITWLDNVRINDWLLSEEQDELCFFDPTGATCRHSNAVADTVVASSDVATVRILSHEVTFRGFTVRAGGLSESNGIYVGTASGGSYRDVRILDNRVLTPGLGESGITGRFDDGHIDGNTVQGFRQGVYLRTHGKAVTVSDNVLVNNGEGVLTYGYSPRIDNNTITDSLVRGVGIGNITSLATGNVPVLRDNTFRGQTPVLGFRDTVTGMHVDARFNDWGAHSRADIEASVENLANNNTVDTRCYRNAADTGFVCPPSAVTFTANPDPAHWNRAMHFLGTAAGATSEIVARTWDLGDGTTASGAQVAHLYRASGTFEVTHTVRDADGYVATHSHTVTTTNDAPVIGALSDMVANAGERLSFTVSATDPNGDGVSIQGVGLPLGASIAGPSASRTFAWTPTPAQAGTHPVSFTATDGDLATTRTIMVTVPADQAGHELSLHLVGSFVKSASPGETLTLGAVVRNDGTEPETVTFTPAGIAAWDVVVPAPVSLAPGESAELTFQATVPDAMPTGSVGLTATSDLAPAATDTILYLVRVPVQLALALDEAPGLGGAATGRVVATFLDGTPVPGASVTVRETPALGGEALVNSVTGGTDGNGTFAFSFSDPAASLPGRHDVSATLRWFGQQSVARGAYDVGL